MSGPELAAETCARRLAPLGISTLPAAGDGPAGSDQEVGIAVDGKRQAALELWLSWYGPAGPTREQDGGEAVLQAMTGLMQVHGRDAGMPRRLGLEVGSVAAGVLAAQGVLAALVGRSRGRPTSAVRTSVLQAALVLVSHSVAAATTGDEWVPAPPAPSPGPPFATADGCWFEMETLDPEAWKRFWQRLGAGDADLGWAWTLFRSRYYRGTCTLPPGLHEATASHSLAAITRVADDCDVSLCPLRSYKEVLDYPGRWDGHAAVRLLARAAVTEAPPSPTQGDRGRSGTGDGLPLAGIRVVEATSRLQGPLAGLLLQMLGAEVTRVEPPGGDIGRMVPPLAGENGSFFACFNRGKRAVEMDLSRAEGRAELAEMATGADVFVHNWRPGKAAEWRLDADELARANPKLVYVEASGWGSRPESRRLVGTDFLVQAHTALGHGLNPKGEPPFPSRALLVDYMGALVTCEGILAGLYARERTGRGCRVESSLLGGAMALQAHVLEALASGQEKGRQGGRPLWGPLDQPIPTVDGFLVVSVEDDAAFRRLCQLCHVDPATGGGKDSDRLVVERLAGQPAERWEELLAGSGIPCAVARTDLAALPSEPFLSELFEPLGGTSRAPTSPWRFDP